MGLRWPATASQRRHFDHVVPPLVLGEDAQAHGPARVDVRVEEDGLELALGRLARVLVAEDHLHLVRAALPDGLRFAAEVARENAAGAAFGLWMWRTFGLPGMTTSQCMMSCEPSALVFGFATKPCARGRSTVKFKVELPEGVGSAGTPRER